MEASWKTSVPWMPTRFYVIGASFVGFTFRTKLSGNFTTTTTVSSSGSDSTQIPTKNIGSLMVGSLVEEISCLHIITSGVFEGHKPLST